MQDRGDRMQRSEAARNRRHEHKDIVKERTENIYAKLHKQKKKTKKKQ